MGARADRACGPGSKKTPCYGAFCDAPGPIRVADLSLWRNDEEEAKEAQKWLWQARSVTAWQQLIPVDKGRFGWV